MCVYSVLKRDFNLVVIRPLISIALFCVCVRGALRRMKIYLSLSSSNLLFHWCVSVVCTCLSVSVSVCAKYMYNMYDSKTKNMSNGSLEQAEPLVPLFLLTAMPEDAMSAKWVTPDQWSIVVS